MSWNTLILGRHQLGPIQKLGSTCGRSHHFSKISCDNRYNRGDQEGSQSEKLRFTHPGLKTFESATCQGQSGELGRFSAMQCGPHWCPLARFASVDAGSVAGRLDFNDVKSTDMVTMAIIQYHPHLRRTCHLYDETQEVKALLLFFVTCLPFAAEVLAQRAMWTKGWPPKDRMQLLRLLCGCCACEICQICQISAVRRGRVQGRSDSQRLGASFATYPATWQASEASVCRMSDDVCKDLTLVGSV